MTALGPACVALALAACGVDTAACGVPALAAPAHATSADVLAIVARDCAVGGCHLRAPGAGGLVLDVTSPAWASAVVGVAAREAPAMALVAPGDPARSWLVAKLSGVFCAAACDRQLGCGGRMPTGTPLSAADEAIIVAWIEAGAP
jgi:hypothetical protein